jgi:NAD(P)-dependent dehydrogenase (short-subunit alcohol dehydrogenase family)/acyl carrier protein
LITGGLGGLGLLVARWLVERGARYLVLMGRSGAASDAAQQAIQELSAAGAKIVVAQGTVARAEDVSQALAGIARDGLPLRGIVHSAGALDDGVLLQQDWTRFERVLAAKVQGSWHLHELTRDQPLDFFVLFSSFSALLGSSGQANHAAANAFLDALAHYRRAQGMPGLSINWGLWSDVGAITKLDEHSRQRLHQLGVERIAPEQGIAAFAGLLASQTVQAGVVPVDWPSYFRSLPSAARLAFLSQVGSHVQDAPVAIASPESPLAQQLAELHPSKRRRRLLEHVLKQVQPILGLDPTQAIDIQQPLSELGLDSLMSLEIRNRLGNTLNTDLPATLLFDYPTVEALTGYLGREVLRLEATPVGHSPGPRADAKPAAQPQTLDDLDHLSDEEAAALLMAELQQMKQQRG